MISMNQFCILYSILKKNFSIQYIANKLDIEDKDVVAELKSLEYKKFIYNESLTELGLQALAPYKVDNAILLAAGTSSRFTPFSLETPKGLLKVRDEILIERQIKQLQEAGISDIVVVVGYMQENFFYLAEKFNVNIVVNTDYFRYNNTSSLILVLDQLKNSYICSSDNYFSENVFEDYVYNAYYSTVFSKGATEEYCVTANEVGEITHVQIGGENSWFMLGHAYFSAAFSQEFKKILVEEYKNTNAKDLVWEGVYIRNIDKLKMDIRKYPDNVIHEFDCFKEVQHFDPSFVKNHLVRPIVNICKYFSCEYHEIQDFENIKEGMTNNSFKFTLKDKKYVYREPGKGIGSYINRHAEAQALYQAQKIGVDKTLVYINADEGWKISHYMTDSRNIDCSNKSEIQQGMKLVRQLHDSDSRSEFDFGLWNTTLTMLESIQDSGKKPYTDFFSLHEKMQYILHKLEKSPIARKCLCHCDCIPTNFLLHKDGMELIDWEYAGNDDPAIDIGFFLCSFTKLSYADALEIMKMYFGRTLTKEEEMHYMGYLALSGYYCFIWALFQESLGKTAGEFTYIWYTSAKFFGQKVLEAYEQA